MKQVVQNNKTGQLQVEDVPCPHCGPGDVLVQNRFSLVSAGTERSMRDFAQKNLLQKAKARPDLVKQVMHKVKQEGVASTFQKVMGRLDALAPLGYSCSGTVVEVGSRVEGIRPGDRVACGGAGWANHAELVAVPRLLCAKVPESVASAAAAYATLGSVALHGVRIAEPTLGETVAVIGLGILGQVACQIVRASGCRTLGIDLAADRMDLASRLGADAVSGPAGAADAAARLTDGRGVDAVLIAAAAPTSEPVELAAELCRDRGRVVVVGDVQMDLPRRPFFQKELAFRISRSYGPGRYDPAYEEGGNDYPLGYVRWTEGRNLAAFVELIDRRQVDVEALTTHTFEIGRATEAYDLISGSERGTALGVLLEYPADEPDRRRVELGVGRKKAAKKTLGVGVIGVGDFARGVILPRLKKIDGVELRGVCSRSGLTARHIGERLGFAFCTADSGEVIEDEGTDLVLVMTRHGEHAGLVEAALKRDKDVFVEKPLALSEAQLGRVYRAQRDGQGRVMVGFNRRYAPATVAAQRFFGEGGPLALTYRINAGPLPPDHWIYDPEEGGGRILGEVCHFIDLCGHLVGASPVMVHAQAMGQGRGDDNVALVLSYEDGSVGQILYTASGSDQMPKERLEVFGAGVVAVIDDFADLTVFDKTKTRRPLKGAQDKGHRAELEALVRGGLGGAWPMDFASAGATTLAALRAVESLGEGAPRPLGWENFVAAEGKDR